MSGYPIMLNLGLLFLRVSLACLMLFAHGLPKLMKFGELSSKFPDPLGVGSTTSLVLAIFAEVACAVLMALGILTRFSAVPLIVTMTVALFVVHADDPWKAKELSAVYLAGFISVLLAGGGLFSLDAVLRSWFVRERKS